MRILNSTTDFVVGFMARCALSIWLSFTLIDLCGVPIGAITPASFASIVALTCIGLYISDRTIRWVLYPIAATISLTALEYHVDRKIGAGWAFDAPRDWFLFCQRFRYFRQFRSHAGFALQSTRKSDGACLWTWFGVLDWEVHDLEPFKEAAE